MPAATRGMAAAIANGHNTHDRRCVATVECVDVSCEQDPLSTFRRILLLGIGLLSACAAAGAPSETEGQDRSPAEVPHYSGAEGAYLQGRFAAAEQNQAIAARAFEQALAADPTNPELLRNAFLASLLSGRAEATALARRLPDAPEAQLLLGNADARDGRWQQAEQRFASLPREGMTQMLAPLLMAWSQYGGGRTEAALTGLRPSADGSRFHGIYALHMALIADQAGRIVEAERYYRVARADLGTRNLRVAQILASWEQRQGRPAAARETLTSLSDGQDELSLVLPALIATAGEMPVPTAIDGMAEAYLAIAATLRQQDALEPAQILLRLALDLRPDLTPAGLLMTGIYESGHHPAQALEVLDRVARTDPMFPLVRMSRARLLEQEGRSDEAMAELAALAISYPDNPLPDIQQGDILRGQSRYKEAILSYDRAVARLVGPRRDAWTVFYARGIAHERAREWPQAEADFQHALELSPDQPFVLNYLGYTWADRGTRLAEARQMIERASAQRPNDAAILDSLGWVMLRQGDTGQALGLLERAVGLEPQDPAINAHLGDAYWEKGRRLEAVFQWHRALTLNPDPDDKARIEKRLRDVAERPLSPSASTGVLPDAPTGVLPDAPTGVLPDAPTGGVPGASSRAN